MILIEHILGNVKKDPVWREKLKDATFDLLILDQRKHKKPLPKIQYSRSGSGYFSRPQRGPC